MDNQNHVPSSLFLPDGRKLGRRQLFKAVAAGIAGASVPAWLTTQALSQTTGSSAIRTDAGFYTGTIGPSDDGPSPQINLPFPINFLGVTFNHLWVNNNGNMTFAAPFPDWVPFDLTAAGIQIVAPCFCDTDTRQGAPTQPVTFGFGTVNCFQAFAANWINVGYYTMHSDKLNSFQGIIIDRSDTGRGNFDIEFNFGKIQWDSSDFAQGTNGLNGLGARVGFSNGTRLPGTSYEFPGSGVASAFLDSGPTPLIRSQLNSTVPGRLRFFARNGHLVAFEEITSQCLTMRPLRYSYNASSRTYSGTIGVTNIGPRGGAACATGEPGGTVGPTITIMMPSLPAGVTLANRTGVTASGAPYITLPSASIPLRGAVRFPVVFSNPGRAYMGTAFQHYPVQIFTGNFVPDSL